MSKNKSKEEDPRKATYGAGEEIKKPDPREELPSRVLTPGGTLLDLDKGVRIPNADLVDLCGRAVDLSEFGEHGENFVIELYEEFLNAVQSDLVSTFKERDENNIDSSKIIDYIPDRYKKFKNKIAWRKQKTIAGIEKRVGYIKWDQNTTFDEWMIFSAATLKWRIEYELNSRMLIEGLSYNEMVKIKQLCEDCLVVIEKWLGLSERKKLISV